VADDDGPLDARHLGRNSQMRGLSARIIRPVEQGALADAGRSNAVTRWVSESRAKALKNQSRPRPERAPGDRRLALHPV